MKNPTPAKKIFRLRRKPKTPRPIVQSSFSREHRNIQKPLSEKNAPSAERRHSMRRASDHDKTRNHLGEVVRKQAQELKIKNGQIQKWEDKERLAEEQVLIRTKAMDSTMDGIFIVDSQKGDFPVIYSNQSFQSMIGLPKKDILGRNYFLLYGPDADPRIIKEITNTMRKGKVFHGEMLNFKKNGEKYWNLLRLAPVRDPHGIVTHYVGIQTDVTLMRQRDLEVKEQREEILHVTRVGKLAEFVSSLAHEISQPLTAILSYAQAAQRMLGDREPEIKKIFKHIVDDNQRAAEVIRRLRSLLKKGTPIREPFDLNVLINETVVLIGTDVIVRNKFIRTHLAEKLPVVYGDRIQLQQVLLNLISNSLDAMEGRPDSREMSLHTFLGEKNTIIVEVKDSGCGISQENMKKIFSHFFTSKPDGLGMGLSISRSIVEAHGGRVECKNNPEGGVSFYFTLPAGKKEAS